MVLTALDNKAGAARDIVALNAGASIYVAGLAPSYADGVKQGAGGRSPAARRAESSISSSRSPKAMR